jgi:hypothetical protein
MSEKHKSASLSATPIKKNSEGQSVWKRNVDVISGLQKDEHIASTYCGPGLAKCRVHIVCDSSEKIISSGI